MTNSTEAIGMTDCVTCNDTSGNRHQRVAFQDLHHLKAHDRQHGKEEYGD